MDAGFLLFDTFLMASEGQLKGHSVSPNKTVRRKYPRRF